MAERSDNTEGSTTGGGVLRDLVKAESLIQIAFVLPLACLIGWFIGSRLDKHFHTSWIMVAGILLGAVGGFIQTITMASHYMKRSGD